MLIFYRPFTDPYFNIAAEEYFVKHASEDMIMIWINEQSVIIGKHQNAFAEINYPYVRVKHIPVIRRISGGGAVYHDEGNVNFTFISKTGKTNQVDFGRFTNIIVQFIYSLGIEVNINKRNSLFAGNLKFSGHAEHIFHDKVLHHGTLLFDTDLDALKNSLMPLKEFRGKAIPSFRSDVGNIAPLLPENIDIHQFIKKLVAWLIEYYPGSNSSHMKIDESDAIKLLSETKYKTWEWNFGYSPAYTFQANIPFVTSSLPMIINVENGKFVKVEFPSEIENNILTSKLKSMIGLLHKEEEIEKFVEENRSIFEHTGVDTVSFTGSFFR